MSKLRNVFRTTRVSIWLLMCILVLTVTSVYAEGQLRPQAAVDIIGSPDAAVTGKFAVGTATPGNKALTVAGVIDFVGAGTVHNYFTQGPGNNMQIRSNVDEYNAVGNSSYAQWNMVMGASLDVFSIRRSPASSTYNEDALFWIEGATGKIGIATVDTSNGATIPFTLQARLHVQTDTGDAIAGITSTTSDFSYGVYGQSDSSTGSGVYGWASDTNGGVQGVKGVSDSPAGTGVMGVATATSGQPYGVWGVSYGTSGRGVIGQANATSGSTYGVYGESDSTSGYGVYGYATATGGVNYGVYGRSDSTTGRGVVGYAHHTSGDSYGVWGQSSSSSGTGVYGYATSTSGITYGVYGQSNSTDDGASGVYGYSYRGNGRGVYGYVSATSGLTYGVYGLSESTNGLGLYGRANATTGNAWGLYSVSFSNSGGGVFGVSLSTSGTAYGVRGSSDSTSGYDFYAAGAGTDYGPFTGAHEVRLSDSFPAEFKAGLIVSATGEAQIRQAADGSVDLSSTLPTVKLADTLEDKAVLGVLVAEVTLPEDHWYVARENERFASVNALGEGRVWVTNMNGGIKAGDGITTSDIPGYGQRQDDDMLHFYTLAKATEMVDWDTVTETVVFNGQEYKVYLLAVVYTSG